MLFPGPTIKGWDCSQCKETFDIALIGDLVLSSRLMRSRFGVHTSTARRYFGKFLSRIQEVDAVFANFEGVIFKHAYARDKKLTEHFTLGFTYEQAAFLTDFHPRLALSLSNNHIADYGVDGIRETMAFLDAKGIPHAGVGTSESAIRFTRVKDAKIAFCAFADMLPERFFSEETELGVSRATEERIRNTVTRLRGEADLVIVSLHIVENVYALPRFMPDVRQKRLAAIASESGADIVFGHHPHRLQAFEKMNTTFILHGLGPFLYDPAISSITHKNSRLYDAVQMGGGGMAVLRCCKHTVRFAQVLPTRTVTPAGGGFVVVPAPLWQRVRLYLFARFSRGF